MVLRYITVKYLEDRFEDRIGRSGTTDWSPRSCDPTSLDFSDWGTDKNNVFVLRPTNLGQFRAVIPMSLKC